jgi:uncharacterized protein
MVPGLVFAELSQYPRSIRMKQFIVRLTRLFLGLALYSLGIVFTLKAHIGFSPWDVFHAGLADSVGITIGLASIVTGLVVVLVSMLLGEKLGLGTILNMLVIGMLLDALLALGLVPQATNFVGGAAMMVAGLFVIALASYYYIGSGFGAGPRDSLMVALTRKTGLPVGLVRGGMELVVVFAGWKLGGLVGAGTILSALTIGLCIQLTFKLLHFDPTAVTHDSLSATFAWVIKRPPAKD